MADRKSELLGERLAAVNSSISDDIFTVQVKSPLSDETVSVILSDDDLAKIAEFRGFTLESK